MKNFGGVLVIGMFSCLGTVIAADPASHPAPMQRGLENIERNSVKNPGNPGLPNAQERVERNILRKTIKDNPHAGDDQQGENAHSNQRAQRTDRVERPERPERAERPERSNRMGRPDAPGRGHKK